LKRRTCERYFDLKNSYFRLINLFLSIFVLTTFKLLLDNTSLKQFPSSLCAFRISTVSRLCCDLRISTNPASSMIFETNSISLRQQILLEIYVRISFVPHSPTVRYVRFVKLLNIFVITSIEGWYCSKSNSGNFRNTLRILSFSMWLRAPSYSRSVSSDELKSLSFRLIISKLFMFSKDTFSYVPSMQLLIQVQKILIISYLFYFLYSYLKISKERRRDCESRERF